MSQHDIQALKTASGRQPFNDWFTNGKTKAACAFHDTDSGEPMTLHQAADGAWLATCHSKCKKSWDAVAWIREREHLSFRDAVLHLSGKSKSSAAAPVAVVQQTLKKSPALKASEWESYGRALEAADIETLAGNREDKTASFETFKRLGVRVKDGALAFPYFRFENGSLYTVKLRPADNKENTTQDHSTTQKGFFNLPAINPIEDVYVVEGEPDVAIMEENGFRAVSVTAGSQRKFDPAALEALSVAERVFLVGDMRDKKNPDDPGPECMDALQAALSSLCADRVFRIRFSDAHDVCQLAKRAGDGFAERIAELSVESLKPWIQQGHVQKIHELSNEPEKWLIDRMIPYQALSLIAGSQGATKSLFALSLAQHIASAKDAMLGRELWTGVKTFGTDVADLRVRFKQHPSVSVVYIDKENAEATINKRRAQLGIVGSKDFFYWGQWNRLNPPPDDVEDPRLLEMARRTETFFIFDSLQQWYNGAEEINNTQMGDLMRKFQRLSRASAGVLVLHHDQKYTDGIAKQSYRGSTSIVSIPDMSIHIKKEDQPTEPLHITLEPIRFRMCEEWVVKYETAWHPAQKGFPYGAISMKLISDNKAAEQIRIDIKSKDELVSFIDKTLTDNPNISKTDLVSVAAKAFPTNTSLTADGNGPFNKVGSVAKKLGWSYDKEASTKWSKKSGQAAVSEDTAPEMF